MLFGSIAMYSAANIAKSRPDSRRARVWACVNLTRNVTSSPTKRNGAPLAKTMAVASGSQDVLNSPGIAFRLVW